MREEIEKGPKGKLGRIFFKDQPVDIVILGTFDPNKQTTVHLDGKLKGKAVTWTPADFDSNGANKPTVTATSVVVNTTPTWDSKGPDADDLGGGSLTVTLTNDGDQSPNADNDVCYI